MRIFSPLVRFIAHSDLPNSGTSSVYTAKSPTTVEMSGRSLLLFCKPSTLSRVSALRLLPARIVETKNEHNVREDMGKIIFAC